MTIIAGDLDPSAFNIQGIGFAAGLAPPIIGCMDVLANNYNIDTDGVYGVAGNPVIFNTQSAQSGPNECTYTGCMDQNSSSFFSTVLNGNTYYATTAAPCDYEGCDDSLALNYNTTCGGYDLTPAGLAITIVNNGCCNYPVSYDCNTVNGGVLTITNGTGAYVVCNSSGLPSGCYTTALNAYAAAIAACPACGSSQVIGCTDDCAPNYDPLATCDDGSCSSAVYGCMDDGSMTTSQVNSLSNSIWPTNACLGYNCTPYDSYISSWSYVDNGTQLNVNLNNSVAANNYDPSATHMDCSCEYIGCTDPNAVNYESFHTIDDGTCLYSGCTDVSALNPTYFNHPNPSFIDSLGNVIVLYTNPILASIDDGSCNYFGCNNIQTPNVLPWNGVPIKETMIRDNAFEKAIESWNENSFNTQMTGLYYGHAGNFDDTVSPLISTGNPSCGIPSTFANNLNNVVDYGNTLDGTCTVTQYLTHMAWEDSTGSFVYDGFSCTQGFANAWGPFDINNWSANATGHNDGFYLQTSQGDLGQPLTSPQYKTIFKSPGANIYDLSGIQDCALNPAFKRLVIHNQFITDFIHTDPDIASPYYQLDMLETLFKHAPNFDFLSFKSCRLGIAVGHQTLDLSEWANCGGIELADNGYDEININHINNPNCWGISIINNAEMSNGNGVWAGTYKNREASGGDVGYSQDLNVDWSTHVAGTIPIVNSAISSEDSDQSWKQAWGYGSAYDRDDLPNQLKHSMYSSANTDMLDPSNPGRYPIGEHFPPQPAGFTGWDASTGFSGDAASHFVPMKKLAQIFDSGQQVHHRVSSSDYVSDNRRGDIIAFPYTHANQTVGYGNFPNGYMFDYQGNIQGVDLSLIPNSNGTTGHYNGFAWVNTPRPPNGTSGVWHNTEIGDWYSSSISGWDPAIKIDGEISNGNLYPNPTLDYVLMAHLVLINLPNLKHVWLGPDWDPKYAMNQYNCQPTNPNPGTNVQVQRGSSRGFSIKGCGNGNTVYVHTAGRALEFKKRYGTNDQNAVDPNLLHGVTNQPQSVYSPEGEVFFLDYFDSNVVFVD